MIQLTNIVQTCEAYPSQWEADGSDGVRYYLRYRCNIGTISDITNILFDIERFSIPGRSDLDGDIDLPLFVQCLEGFEL